MLRSFIITLLILGFTPFARIHAQSFTTTDDTVSFNANLCPMAIAGTHVLVAAAAVEMHWHVVASDFPADWIPIFTINDYYTLYSNSTLGVWDGATGPVHTSVPYPASSSVDFMLAVDMHTTTTPGTHWMEIQLTDPVTAHTENIWFIVTPYSDHVSAHAGSNCGRLYRMRWWRYIINRHRKLPAPGA